ncbi:hypothetical protein HY030_02445 [Candidatus Gottesmanbacteria bacterium]|nr:hypothetical protein [Candidatus Gottesmanbacteria bacterium]
MFIEDIVISRVRVKVFNLFFQNPGQIFHVREVVRRTDEEINAIRRELAHLEKAGLLSKEPRANRLYYALRKDYPLYADLANLVAKTSGLGHDLIKNKNKIGRVKYAMFSGRFVRHMPLDPEKVDLLLVGQIILTELNGLIKSEEEKRGHEINYTAMTDEEFNFRKKRRDPFIVDILMGTRLMLIGDEEEMLKVSD